MYNYHIEILKCKTFNFSLSLYQNKTNDQVLCGNSWAELGGKAAAAGQNRLTLEEWAEVAEPDHLEE